MYYNINCKGRLTQLLKSCRSYKDKASCRIQHPVIYGGVFSFCKEDKNISFEFVDNKTKFLLFLSMLQVVITDQSEKVLLVLLNMDD